VTDDMERADQGNQSTRERLLDAAGEVFAKHGFHHATIRDICGRAGSNVAAVNYHFGDKERLYAAVLEYADRCTNEEHPIDAEFGAGLTPEQRLHELVRRLVSRIFGAGRAGWYAKLMARELVDPSKAIEPVVERSYRPQLQQAVDIVRELMGNQASEEEARICAFSVVGQCVFFHHARTIIGQLDPQLRFGPEDIERLADHITRFSIPAIRNVKREGYVS
jgi:AcrR family transcriptional regulator